MQLGEEEGFNVGLICGSKTFVDDFKQHWVCHSEK